MILFDGTTHITHPPCFVILIISLTIGTGSLKCSMVPVLQVNSLHPSDSGQLNILAFMPPAAPLDATGSIAKTRSTK